MGSETGAAAGDQSAIPGPARRALHRRADRPHHRPAIRALPVIGAADQFIDSTDVLGHCEMTRTVTRALINRN